MEEIETGVLIVGAGGAGLMAALHLDLQAPGLPVTIAVKGLLGQCGCTRMVQGGYNAVMRAGDSFDKHFLDTVRGGGWINNQELAWTLVREAPERIVELENRVGCLFDRNPDGTIHQKAFAGQSFDRTVHKGDLTGIEIMSNLRDYVIESGARVLEETRALDLLVDDGRVRGALLLSMREGRFILVRARAVLVATGGGATMYRIASPSLEKSGDGMAMAARAGAVFVDMEMLQFHPTGLLVGRSIATGGLLEEGLRGAGARLFNGRGDRYMARYDAERLERATRDVVSRASFHEIRAGRGTPAGGVYLDVSHLAPGVVERDFPGMVARCRDYGFDLVHQPVEVSPSAHYQMGGVRIDRDGRTGIAGLFAAGEDAGGVHGANRLGGNGVADSIVFGARAGGALAGCGDVRAGAAIPTLAAEHAEYWSRSLLQGRAGDVFAMREELNNLMWNEVGILRTGAGLKRAGDRLAEMADELAGLHTPGPLAWNAAWQERMNLQNLIATARLMTASAEARTESRGAHFREDFPQPEDAWLRNVLIDSASGKIWTEPVAFSRLRPE
ncbi:MAG: FAD-binding protein [Acidobacteria bacterium]|nr:FAD-binding protein [Acidobacteriota bacterium]